MEQVQSFIPSRQDEKELKTIAKGICTGEIFCDRHIKNPLQDAQVVFMPIALGALSTMTEDQVKDVGMIYEYLSEAGGRCVNGYPTFMSMKLLNRADTEKVIEYAKQYHSMTEKWEQS